MISHTGTFLPSTVFYNTARTVPIYFCVVLCIVFVVLYIVLFLFCVLCVCVCKCVLYYRHQVSTQLQLTNISEIILAKVIWKYYCYETHNPQGLLLLITTYGNGEIQCFKMAWSLDTCWKEYINRG
jgi:hypothetical protein